MNKNFQCTTFALPYANGQLHVGHLFEATLADIYAKINQNFLISGSDCHGSSITLKAHQEKTTPLEIVEKNHNLQKNQYQQICVKLDNFSLTASINHKLVVNWCVEKIKENNPDFFVNKQSSSWYDEKESLFLSERYIKGQCPNCLATEQICSDECKKCQYFIEENELLNPISTISNNPLKLKSTNHIFINSKNFINFCEKNKHLINPGLLGKIFNENLKEKNYIDISRNKPYFGIDIENFLTIENQAFYVWFDAPIGYLTFSFENWCKQYDKKFNKENFYKFLSQITFTHFIGKDIAYFHLYFWLNLLYHITQEQKIIKIFTHGWLLNPQGEKLSKSLGSKIDLTHWKNNQIDALRLWFFSSFKNTIEDKVIDQDFIQIYNKLCVDKFANFFYRLTVLLNKKNVLINGIKNNDTICKDIHDLINDGKYSTALKKIDSICDELNQSFVLHKAWNCSDKELEVLSRKWLQDFFSIYDILKIICPGLYNEVLEKWKSTQKGIIPAIALAYKCEALQIIEKLDN